MSSEGPLDLAIIGGGAAGTYAAHRLRAAHPEWSISLLEASGRIGGRLLSVIPPGGGGQVAELGGMRFREGHRLVSDAVRSLGLKTRPFSTAHAQNRFYLRGMARTAGDAPEQRGRGYRLEGWERDKTPGELLMAAFERVIPGAVGLSEAELAALIPSREFNGRPLYELSLDDVFAATLSADAHRFVLDSFGYDSGIRPHNAADGIPYLLREAGPHLEDQQTPIDGMERLPRALADRFEADGGEVLLGHRLTGFHAETGDEDPVLCLQFEGRPAIMARRLILALPRMALESVATASPPMQSPEISEMLAAVEAYPAHKLYLLYERPWWREGPGSGNLDVSDLPLRKTYYLDGIEGHPGEGGLVLATYTDGVLVDPWRSLIDGRAPRLDLQPFGSSDRWDDFAPPQAMVDAAQQHLRIMHGRPEIPEPVSGAFISWDVAERGGAWHYWRAGARSWEVKPRIVQPVLGLDVYVCGEAYSTAQAWVEGALETAEVVVQRLR